MEAMRDRRIQTLAADNRRDLRLQFRKLKKQYYILETSELKQTNCGYMQTYVIVERENNKYETQNENQQHY
jgi:hypothetical protein